MTATTVTTPMTTHPTALTPAATRLTTAIRFLGNLGYALVTVVLLGESR